MGPPEPPVRCARQARGLSRALPARGAGSPPLPAWILPEWRCAQCAAQCYIASSVWRAGALARWRRNCAARSCPLRRSKFRGARVSASSSSSSRRRRAAACRAPRRHRGPCARPASPRTAADCARAPAARAPTARPRALPCAQPTRVRAMRGMRAARFRMSTHGPAPRAVAEARSLEHPPLPAGAPLIKPDKEAATRQKPSIW